KFAAETLQVPASGLGLLMAMMALGSFVGNGVVANLRPGAPLGRWMFVLGIMSGVSLIALGLTRGMYLALGALFLTGLAGGPFFTINQTLVQRLSPVEIRGRVLSLWMLTWGAMPLGIMGASALGDQIGFWFPMVLGGASLVLVMVVVLFTYPALLRVSEEVK
ncbi:MAG: MFS transporter, partial [Chloroflexota bacterium]